MKIDPYRNKERYIEWKERAAKGIRNLNKINSDTIFRYVTDMELGLNVSVINKKGSRSYIRLTSIIQRMVFLANRFEKLYNISDITKITEKEVHSYFSGMRNGTILQDNGKPYMSTGDFVKNFKAFWHWHQKIKRKEGIDVPDITIDLDTSREKPKWVYLTEEQVKKICENAKYEYKVLIMFLFDTGIRAPTELLNVRVSDFINDFSELIIRDEASKTFGRRIKLMLCSDMIKGYVNNNKLSGNDYLFKIVPNTANKYLKRLSKKLFGEGKSSYSFSISNLFHQRIIFHKIDKVFIIFFLH